jgi:hypothetical protein
VGPSPKGRFYKIGKGIEIRVIKEGSSVESCGTEVSLSREIRVPKES